MEFDLDLGQLFALADAIGDQYLTPEEIEARDAELALERLLLEVAISEAEA